MRSASSKLQARTRIVELGLYAAQARKRPSCASTRTVSPGSALPLAMLPSNTHGWRRSSERSLPSRRRMRLHRPVASRVLAPRGMRRVVDLGQVLEVELRVDLRGRDVGVAEQLLHRAQVAAGLQQVRGERVAQHVRVHVRRQAGLQRQRASGASAPGWRVSRVPRRLTKSAGSSARGQLRAQRQPGRAAPPAPARPPARCAACCPCRAHARWRRQRRSSRPRRRRRARPGRPVRRRAGRSRRAARRCRRRAPPAPGRRASAAVLGQRHRLVDRQRLGQRLGRLRRAHAVDRVAAHQRRCARASGTARARPTARARCCAAPGRRACSCAAQRRTCCGLHLRAARTPALRRRRCRRRSASRRSPACAPPGAARRAGARGSAATLGAASARRGALIAQPSVGGSSRASAGAGDLADARQEVGAHVGAVARRVGRAEHQQAEGAARLGRGAAGSAPATSRCAGSSSHCAASKPALTPQYGMRQAGGEALRVVADRLRERQRGVARRPRPRRGCAACGIRNCVLQLAHQHLGQLGGVGGEQQRARPAVQPVGDGRRCPGRCGSSR